MLCNYIFALDLSINCTVFLSFLNQLNFDYKNLTTNRVSGPTLRGQTRLVQRIYKENLIQLIAIRIIWVYSTWQPDYNINCDWYSGIEIK